MREMPEPLIPAEWANGLMEMIRASDWGSWNEHDRKVAIIQVRVLVICEWILLTKLVYNLTLKNLYLIFSILIFCLSLKK